MQGVEVGAEAHSCPQSRFLGESLSRGMWPFVLYLGHFHSNQAFPTRETYFGPAV